MIAVIQRVTQASVKTDGKLISSIKKGYVILLGIHKNDKEKDAIKLCEKIVHMRLMADYKNKMNLSLIETKCEALVISQFTLCANLNYGRRPSFIEAALPKRAWQLYELFASELKKHIRTVRTGSFNAYMEVSLVNDGPVTIIVESNSNKVR